MEYTKVTPEIINYYLRNLKQLAFEVTDRCNLKCVYCGYSDLYEGFESRSGQNLQFNKAKIIIDYLCDLWKKDYVESFLVPLTISFYGGEPLVNMPLIKEIIDYIEKKKRIGKRIQYSMTTNAILLKKYVDFLVEKKFSLLISLDGNKEAQSYRIDHANINSFDQVTDNVRFLKDKHPEYFDEYVRFNSVLHNKNSVEGTFNFINREFGKKTKISILRFADVKPDKLEVFNTIYQDYYQSFSKAKHKYKLIKEMFTAFPYISELGKYIKNHSGNIYECYNDLLTDKTNLKVIPTGTCIPFAKKMFITVAGKILQCERINHKYKLGFIDNKVHLDLKEIADLHNKRIYKYIHQCKKCGMRKNCNTCVFALNFPNTDSNECPDFILEKDSFRQKEMVINYLRKNPQLYSELIQKISILN